MDDKKMNGEFDFSLPRHTVAVKSGGSGAWLLLLLIILVLAAQVCALWLLRRPQTAAAAKDISGSSQLSSEELESLAMRLENQGLRVAAVAVWHEYLADYAGADKGKIAKVWYRIARLNQESDNFADALAAYYRSEALAEIIDLKPEINRRTQECLEKLGRFSALRYELAGRVGLDSGSGAAGNTVLAEIGGSRITRADLEQLIEDMLERQLSQYAGRIPEAEIQKQRQQLLQRLSSETERQRILERYVLEELLYREARATGLAENPDVRSLVFELERQTLAGKMLEKTLESEIKISANDIETYYQANRQNYLEPARARVSHILLADENETAAALSKLRGGHAFEELARELSIDKESAANGGEIPGFIRAGQPQIPGIGSLPEAVQQIFQSDPGELLERPFKSDRGFHVFKVRELEPERQKPFNEVRSEVYSALRQLKEREVQEAFFEKLRHKYNAVIHPSRIQTETPDTQNPR